MNRIFLGVFSLLPPAYKCNKPVLTIVRNTHLSLYSRNTLFNSLQRHVRAVFKFNATFPRRSYSSDSDNEKNKNKSTALMKFEPILKPEIILTIKNWILTKLIIQPYLDNDFTLKDFTSGSKQALGIVSTLLSQGDFKSLEGLVANEAIQEIKNNFSALNIKERQDLFVRVTDILFAFPYQIGIFFDDINQKRFAEITVVYHCMNDFEEMKNQGKVLTEHARDDIKICNYRFIREYTKGVQSDWIINRIGHFKLRDFET